MKISKISIGKSVEALGQWNKGGLEAEIKDGDDVNECWNALKHTLDAMLPSVNGNYENNFKDANGWTTMPYGTLPITQPIPTIQVSKIDKAIMNIKEEIMNCKDVVTLQTYRKIANTDEELVSAFNSKMKELQ